MFDLGKALLDGAIFSLIGSIYLIGILWYNPRLAMNPGDYPDDVIAAAPPKTKKEQRLAIIFGIPFLIFSFAYPVFSTLALNKTGGGATPFLDLFLHILVVIFFFNLVDLLILDLWMFCTITPKFVVIPGTEGFPGYKDKGMHIRAHVKASVIMVALGFIIAWVISVIG
jgi:hypothetical protein